MSDRSSTQYSENFNKDSLMPTLIKTRQLLVIIKQHLSQLITLCNKNDKSQRDDLYQQYLQELRYLHNFRSHNLSRENEMNEDIEKQVLRLEQQMIIELRKYIIEKKLKQEQKLMKDKLRSSLLIEESKMKAQFHASMKRYQYYLIEKMKFYLSSQFNERKKAMMAKQNTEDKSVNQQSPKNYTTQELSLIQNKQRLTELRELEVSKNAFFHFLEKQGIFPIQRRILYFQGP